MKISEAIAFIQAEAEKSGWTLEGPNWASKEGEEVRNLYQEAEKLSLATTGNYPEPVIVVPPPGITLETASQAVVEEVKQDLNLVSVKYANLAPVKKIKPIILISAGVGVLLLGWVIFRPSKKKFGKK